MVVAIVLLGVAGVLVATAGPVAAADPLTETITYRQTPETGTVEATIAYTTPDPLAELSVTLPAGATVVDREGFASAADGAEWDGETDRPTLTVRLAVNETGREIQRAPSGSGLIFADTADWALFTRPSTTLRYSARERLSVERDSATDGPGVAGSTLVFLGEHELTTRTVDGQRIEYVRPAGTDPAVAPTDTLDALAYATRELSVGARSDRMVVVAAPTTVDWGVAGLQVGRSDFWVRADQPLGVGSTWYHEYVHARQGFETTDRTAWTTEGMATYYAALLGLQRDGTVESFQRTLAVGATDRYDDVRLADPATWNDDAPYRKGSLAVGQIDRRIRLASNGTRSFQRVWSELNRATDPTDAEMLYETVGTAGNDSVADHARRVADTGPIEMWSASQHRRAFGAVGPSFRVSHATAVTIEGGEQRSVEPWATATVGPGETVSVTYRVSNAGDAPGSYEIPVVLGDRTVDRLTGRLDPGESTTHAITVAPDRPGRTALYAGDAMLDVRVVDPPIRVLDLEVTTDPVVVTATVAGNATWPANGSVTIRWNDRVVANRTVDVPPGETRTVSVEVSEVTPGNHTVSAGNRSAQVTIREPPPTAGVGPGVGPAVALVAVLLASIRRWSRLDRS